MTFVLNSCEAVFVSLFQVKRDDATTKICRECFDMINEYFPFLESCSTKNINYLLRKIGMVMKRPTEAVAVGDIGQSNSIHEIASDEGHSPSESNLGREDVPCEQPAPIMCITLTDTESEDEEVNVDLQHPKFHNEIVSSRSNDGKVVQEQINSKFSIECMGKCKEFFGSKEAMAYHKTSYQRRGIKKTFECYLCKITFAEKLKFRIHMNAVHTTQSSKTVHLSIANVFVDFLS